MTETEALYKLPTAVFRDTVRQKVGVVYSYLLLHMDIVFIVIVAILLIILIRTVSLEIMKRKAKKSEPVSTNNWFDWEDFEIWKKERKKGGL